MKYFFFDLDGSLMYNDSLKTNETFIPSKNVEMLKKLDNHENVEIGIASGRIASVSNIIFQKENLNGWIIGENGGTLVNKEGEYLYKKRISKDTYASFIKHALENGYHFEAYTDEYIFVNQSDDNHSEFLDGILEKMDGILTYKNVLNFDDIVSHLDEINHFSFVPFVDQSNVEQIKSFLNDFNDEVNYIHSSIDIIDTLPINIDKIAAFKQFLELNSIDKENVYYLGDGFNDQKSLEYFENSFVMEHAHDDLKANAKHVVNSAAHAMEIFLSEVNK